MLRPDVSTIIPVLNEVKSIPRFLNDLTRLINQSDVSFQVIFVDNGSQDGSYELLAKFIHSPEAQKSHTSYEILLEPSKGKGRAVRRGIEHTFGEYVVIIDADNEYNLSDFQTLLKVIQNQKVDLVLGTRYSGKPIRRIPNQPLRSWYFNRGHSFFTWYFNKLFQTDLTDPATMWKLMRGNVARSLNLTGNTFNLDFELVASFTKLKKIIIEVPVQYEARSKSDGKKIKFVLDPIIWTVSFLRYSMRPQSHYLKSSILEKGGRRVEGN